jgi:hypothetical protein
MAIPQAPEARLYYRAGRNRYDDAEFLLENQRTTGAVYLAGYGVECLLKCLILSACPSSRRADVMNTFRGSRAHDFGWLKSQYAQYWKGGVPAEIAQDFVRVATWSTDLRYVSSVIRYREAKVFLESAAKIIKWIDERL